VVAAFKEQRGGFVFCSVGTLDGERRSGAVRSSEGDGAMDRWRAAGDGEFRCLRRLCGDGDRATTVSSKAAGDKQRGEPRL